MSCYRPEARQTALKTQRPAFRELSVVAREAIRDRAGGDRPQTGGVRVEEAAVRTLARELGVSWIVSGGFQRVGDQLRITARIMDVESGEARETASRSMGRSTTSSRCRIGS